MQWDLANEYFLWEAFNKKVLRGGGGGEEQFSDR